MKIIKESKKDTLEYVSELISDMESGEGKLFSKTDLKKRMAYIRSMMSEHGFTLSNSEILALR